MSSWRRIGLYSNRKVTDNFETESPKNARKWKYHNDLYETIHLNSQNTLLEQTLDEPNPNDVQTIKPYVNRITFFTTSLNDPNFDVLTPDFEQTMIQETVIEVQLCTDNFTFLNKQNGSILPFEYRHEFLPFLIALESGVVTRELYKLFQSLKGAVKDKTLYINGKMPISIVDFRVSPEKSYYTELTLSPDILDEFDKNPSTNVENYGVFSKFNNLIICTDPSPNVSRFHSYIDWREKMWHKDRKIEDDPKPPEKREPKKEPKVPVIQVKEKEGKLDLNDQFLLYLRSIPMN